MAIHIRSVALKTWKSVIRVCILLFLTLVIFIAMLLGTEGGRIGLVKQALNAWALVSQQQIELVGLRSPSIGQWAVGQVVIEEIAAMPRIELRDVSIDWRWQYAIQNRWWFRTIEAKSVHIEMAQPETNSGEQFSGLYQRWAQIPAIRAERLHIEQLTISRPRYPDLTGQLDAQTELNWGVTPARLLVSLTEASTANQYALQISADAVQQVRLQGSLQAQADSNWARWIKWQLPEAAKANWDLKINYSRPGFLSVDIDQWEMPWQSHQLTATGSFEYDINQIKLNFMPLALSVDERPAVIEGWIKARESELYVSIDQWPIAPFAELFNQPALSGTARLAGHWYGGWQQPRIQGQLDAKGSWQTFPYQLSLQSEAGLSAIHIAQGDLSLAGNQFSLQGTLDWRTEQLDIEVLSQISTDPLLRQQLPEQLAEVSATAEVVGRIYGNYRQPAVEANILASGRWREDAFQVSTQANWADGKLNLQDLYVYSQPLQLGGHFAFDAQSQQWQGEFEVREWRHDILARLNVDFPIPFQGSGHGRVALKGQGSQYSVAGEVNVQGLWQQWPFNARLNIQNISPKQMTLAASSLRLGAAEAVVYGNVDWSNKTLDLSLNHQDWPLTSLPPWLSFWPDIMSSLDGRWSGKTHLYGLWRQPAIATDSQLVGEWLAEPLVLSLQTKPASATQWAVPTFNLNWLGADWQYTGEFYPYQLTLDGQAQVAQLAATHIPLLSKTFTGSEKSLPETMAVALAANMAIAGKITSPVLNGQASMTGWVDQDPFEMSAELTHLDTQKVDIKAAQGQWANGAWQLSGLYNWRQNDWAMNIATQTPDVAYLVPWLSLAFDARDTFNWLAHWSGSLNGELFVNNLSDDWQIEGDLNSAGWLYGDAYTLNWQGRGQLNEALNHTVRSRWGVAELSLDLVSDAREINGSLRSTSLSFEQIRRILPSVPAVISGVVNGHIDISGELHNPTLDAQLTTQGQLNTVNPHRFKANAKVAGSLANWQVEQAEFEIPNAARVTVAGSGQYAEAELQIEGQFPDTTYWIKNDELGPGNASFSMTMNGPLNEADLTGAFNWQAMQWPLSVRANLSTVNEQYVFDASLYSQQSPRIKTSLVAAKLPLNELANQWDQHPVVIQAVVNSALSVFDPLLKGQPEIKIAGQLAGQLEMSGSFTQPFWQGELFWQKGRFEHAAYGSLIDGVELSLTGEQQQWQLNGLANDGRKGVISLAGVVDFSRNTQQALAHEMNISVGFGQAHLLNQSQMDAAISGALTISGAYQQALVAGELIVSPLTLQSDTFLWDGAPQLNIVAKDAVGVATEPSRPFYWPDGSWQVRLVAQNRVNLYGQGISAELQGELALADNFYQPEISGRFNLVRGTYAGLGKVFTLENGSVQLQNNQLVLDIQGAHTAKMKIDKQIQQLPIVLRITGNQQALNLELSTSADLDQDEILAQLLFGKIVAELDVVQAIQLANVINKLRTGNSGFDIIGATRDSFDLDTLVIDTESDEEGNLLFNVSAGKYLTDFLYLEVEQDVGTELDIRGSLQYQVTPNTNLELYTQGSEGQLEDSGVELNWSWDY